MVDINEKYVVYYAVRGYASGETVTIDIFDTVGGKEIDAGIMTELNSTGIYTFNFFPRKRTSYLAVTNCAAKPRQTHEIIRVKQQKIGGAVRPIIQKDTLTPVEKKLLFLRLSELSAMPELPKLPDYSKPLTEIHNQFKDIKIGLSQFKTRIVRLSDTSKKLNSETLKQVSDRLRESLELVEKKFDTSLSKTKKLIMDEVSLANKLNLPKDFSKIENYLTMIDDINLIVKNGIKI